MRRIVRNPFLVLDLRHQAPKKYPYNICRQQRDPLADMRGSRNTSLEQVEKPGFAAVAEPDLQGWAMGKRETGSDAGDPRV
jgi:hypothetical protein